MFGGGFDDDDDDDDENVVQTSEISSVVEFFFFANVPLEILEILYLSERKAPRRGRTDPHLYKTEVTETLQV